MDVCQDGLSVPIPDFYGWLDWPVNREAVADRWGSSKRFANAAPGLMAAGSDRKDVFLFRAFVDVFGKFPSYPAQGIGDCVSHGSTRSADLTQCLEIALGQQEEFYELSTEVTYGLMREHAGLLRKRFDGGFTTAAGEAVTKSGVVRREDAGGEYDAKRAKEFGFSGVPKELKEQAKLHLFERAALVTTLEELDAAIDNGYVGAVGSDQGFTMERDAEGACKPKGSWQHCMAIGWARKKIGSAVHYLICQSWGPNVPSGPTPDGMPDCTFYADERTVARMIKQQDCVFLSGFNGFEKRPLPPSWSYSGWI